MFQNVACSVVKIGVNLNLFKGYLFLESSCLLVSLLLQDTSQIFFILHVIYFHLDDSEQWMMGTDMQLIKS